MTEPTKTETAKPDMIVLIDNRLLPSLISDAASFGIGVSFMGLGWLMGSGAMQWAGFIAFFVVVFARAHGKTQRQSMTPQAAADLLLEKYAVLGQGGRTALTQGGE